MTITRSKNSPLSDGVFFERMLSATLGPVQREFRFHPKRKWRIDYFATTYSLGVEIEGGIWRGGRHTNPAGFTKDIEKYNAAALMGITIYRIPAYDLKSPKKVMEHVQRIRYYIIEKRHLNG